MQIGGTAPTIMNAANEIAVQGFLDGKIGFLRIAAIVEETLSRLPLGVLRRLEDVHGIDREARHVASALTI